MFFRRIPSISTKDLNEKLNEKPLIIDVRTPNEFKSAHIKGAKNVPLQTIHSYHPKQKAYVICASGMRSKQAKSWIRTAMMWLMSRVVCINGMARPKEENRNESSDYWRGCRRDVSCHSSKKIK